MKVQFSRDKVFVPDFNGNKSLPEEQRITVKIGVMEMADFVDIAEALQVVGNGEISSDKLDPEQLKAMVKSAGQYLPKYASDLKNLEDDNGPVDVTGLLKFPIYFGLAAEILLAIVEASSLSEADVKN